MFYLGGVGDSDERCAYSRDGYGAAGGLLNAVDGCVDCFGQTAVVAGVAASVWAGDESKSIAVVVEDVVVNHAVAAAGAEGLQALQGWREESEGVGGNHVGGHGRQGHGEGLAGVGQALRHVTRLGQEGVDATVVGGGEVEWYVVAHQADGLHGVAAVGTCLYRQGCECPGEGVDGVHDVVVGGLLGRTEDDGDLALVAEAVVQVGLLGVVGSAWQEVRYVLLVVQLQREECSCGKQHDEEHHGEGAVAGKVVVQA